MSDPELDELREKLLHRWRLTDAELTEAIHKLLAELERLRKLEQG
jgi:hypothetical protein